MRLAQRVLGMTESVTLASSAKAKALKSQGRDIIDLTLGEPDFVTPKAIQETAISSIRSGQASFYTQASGLPELKTSIQTYIKTYYGYEPQVDEIVVGTGAKFILYAFFMSVLDEGDEVLIPTPYWVSYADQVELAQGRAVFVPTDETSDFKVSVEQLEASRTPKTKVLVLNSPSNPTGMIYDRDSLEAIGNWAIAHDIIILADDIYGRLVYNGATFVPLSSLSDAIRQQTVVVNGLSKTYAMTGWRVGFAVGEPEIIAAMGKIISQTTSNVTTVSQYAAMEALVGDQNVIEEMRQSFEERLNVIYPLVTSIPGFQLNKPQGAFYLFPNVSEAMVLKGYEDVTDFTNAILEQTGVALVTGAGFGAPNNVRLSYATDLETLKAAVERLTAFMTNTID